MEVEAVDSKDVIDRVAAGVDCLIILDGQFDDDRHAVIRESDPELPIIISGTRGPNQSVLADPATDVLTAASLPTERLASRIEATIDGDRMGRGQTKREPPAETSERRFRAVFEDSFEAMCLADDAGIYLEVNEQMSELLGLPAAEIVGTTIADYLPTDADFEATWSSFLEQGRERGRITLIRPDGAERIVDYAATADVVPGEHLSIMRDVTEVSAYVEELETTNARLEEFASMVSHDFKSPLTIIQGRLDLYRRTADEDHLDRAEDATDRLHQLVTDLSTLARHGSIDVIHEPVSLAAVAEDAWSMIDARAATLEVDDATIRGDASLLQGLFENLFRNAVGHGGADVTVRVAPLEHGFVVEDDGDGIDPDDRDRVFDHDFTTGYGGSGYGLTIVDRIATAHGFDVTLTESAWGGARFEFVGGDE